MRKSRREICPLRRFCDSSPDSSLPKAKGGNLITHCLTLKPKAGPTNSIVELPSSSQSEEEESVQVTNSVTLEQEIKVVKNAEGDDPSSRQSDIVDASPFKNYTMENLCASRISAKHGVFELRNIISTISKGNKSNDKLDKSYKKN